MARQSTKAVQEKAEHIHDKVMASHDETKQIVQYMHYLDECGEKIEDLKKELEYAYNVFKIMKQHGVIVLDDLKDLYLDVEEMLQHLDETLQKKIEAKPFFVEKLSKSLEGDIKKIFDQVENVRQEIIKPWFLDVSSMKIIFFINLCIVWKQLNRFLFF